MRKSLALLCLAFGRLAIADPTPQTTTAEPTPEASATAPVTSTDAPTDAPNETPTETPAATSSPTPAEVFAELPTPDTEHPRARFHLGAYGGITGQNTIDHSLRDSENATIANSTSGGNMGTLFGVDIRSEIGEIRHASLGFAIEYSTYNYPDGSALDNQFAFYLVPRFDLKKFFFNINVGAMCTWIGETVVRTSSYSISLESPSWSFALSPRVGIKPTEDFGIELGALFSTGKVGGQISSGDTSSVATRVGLLFLLRFDFF
jgi:hypothetical protein